MPLDPELDETLIARLPLPLAQLYRRAHNAKSVQERHQNAYFLWEASLKLLGSVCIVEYVRFGEVDVEMAEVLQNLARPALGHWWEFTRRIVPILADKQVPGFAEVRDLLLGKARGDLPRSAGLDVALLETLENKRAGKSTVYPAELFDKLVRYRNREFGHGAAGNRGHDFYDRMGRSLFLGISELLAKLDVLAGRQLLFIAEVRQSHGIWLVPRYELIGETARRLESLAIPKADTAKLLDAERVYVALANRLDDTREISASLHPLFVFDLENNACFFLNSRRGKQNIEYLCYTTGKTETKTELAGEQRSLLAKALGLPELSQTDFANWQARSRADEGEPEPTSVASPLRHLGDFELLSELGRGGMGVVYRAWQPSLGRQIALKTLTKPGDSKAEARFRREIKALGQVEHPHLVKILTDGSYEDQMFYVMELVEGAPLSAVCEKLSTESGRITEVDFSRWQQAVSRVCQEARDSEKSLSNSSPLSPLGRGAGGEGVADSSHQSNKFYEPADSPAKRQVAGGPTYIRQIATLMQQVADATHALHTHGIIHRDIKPGNILIDAEGTRATLMDLGLAQVADDEEGRLTRTRQFVGTLRFASPEQVLAVSRLDPRSDVYSLGATLWELLALRPLFGATDQTPIPDLMLKIQQDEPERLRSVQRDLPRDLEAIAHKCLEKKPGNRYQSAQELADELARYLHGEPVQARPVGRLDRTLKWVRRHPKESAVGGLTLAVAVLVLIGGGFAMLWRDAHWARERAEGAEQIAKQKTKEVEEEKKNVEGEKKNTELALQGKLDAEQKTRETGQELIAEFQYIEAIRRAQQFRAAGSGDQAERELQATDPKRRALEWEFLAQPLPHVLKGHSDHVESVSFSPDGLRLASGSRDGTVRIWDLAAGGEALVLNGHSGEVYGVSFSPDGRRLASYSRDRTVRVWDLAAGGEAMVLKGHSNEVSSVSFSLDGRRLASGSIDCTVRVWDLAAGGDALVLKGHSHAVTSVSFSPDGRRLASGSKDKTVRVWDLATGGDALVLNGHSESVMSVSFCPDGRRLASGSSDSTVRVWDLAAGGEALVLKGHSYAVTSVSFSPDGNRLASGSTDRTVRVWDLAAGGDALVLKGHSESVMSVSFSPDGRRLASGSIDKTVRVWDLAAAGEALLLKGHSGYVWSVSFSPDGRRLAGGSDETVRVWDLAAGGDALILKGQVGEAYGVSFSPDGRRLASGAGDVRVWDLAAGGDALVLMGHSAVVHGVSFSPDGRRLASGSNDQTVRVWDLAAGGEALVLKGHSDSVSSVCFSPDGRRLASGSNDGTVRVWDLAAGGEALVLKGRSDAVRSVSFSPDGRHLASGSSDWTVRVWDLAAGGDALVLKGHSAAVYGVSFSPDGRRLASGSFDNTVRVWDLAAGGEVLVLLGHSAAVRSVSFSPDGRRLASGSFDKTIRVWEIDCQHLWRLRQATDAERNKLWFSARFHLGWLIREEAARQCLEMVSGLTSPSPFGSAGTLVALQDREGRVPLPELRMRYLRACIMLGGWRW